MKKPRAKLHYFIFVNLLLSLFLSSCIEHRSELVHKQELQHHSLIVTSTTRLKTKSTAIPTTSGETIQATASISSGGLAQSIEVHGYHRREDGSLEFSHQRIMSPLPWWQRFPFDAISDTLWPMPLVSSQSATLETYVVKPIPSSQLDTLAQKAGYANTLEPAQ